MYSHIHLGIYTYRHIYIHIYTYLYKYISLIFQFNFFLQIRPTETALDSRKPGKPDITKKKKYLKN